MNAHSFHSTETTNRTLDLTLRFPVDLTLDFNQLDPFLSEGFALDEPGFLSNPIEMTGGLPDNIQKIVPRLSFLANALLQAVNVPLFDAARIVDFKASRVEGICEVRIIVPRVSFLPERLIANGHSIALKTLLAFKKGNGPVDHQAIFTKIQTDFVEPLKGKVPGGVSAMILLEMAHSQNVPFCHLGSGIYQLGWGQKSRRFDRFTSDADSAIARKLAIDKRLAYRVLNMAGCPVPRQIPVTTVEQANAAAIQIGFPVVLKPADRERGEGVVLDITSAEAVELGFNQAQKYSKSLVVEEQIPGTCHRIFVANGKARSAHVRYPLQVTGDGIHSIAELVEQENRSLEKRALFLRPKPLVLDEVAMALLKAAGKNKDSVPASGEYVPLRRVESIAEGGRAVDVIDKIHPDNLDLAEMAARLTGLDIAGIDIISTDIAVPWHQNGAMVNEVNFAPMVTRRFSWNRAFMPGLIGEMFPGEGRIPIIACVGDEQASERASDLQAEFLREGKSYHICDPERTISPDGRFTRYQKEYSQADRLFSLLMDHSTEAVILVVPSLEYINTHLPIDKVSWIIEVPRTK
jgi:cyanophycin synthetase